MEIQHFSHEHPLTLQMVNTSDFRNTRCYACGKYTLDLMYSCKTCKNYRLHKTCTELPYKIDRHPFHYSHALTVVFHGSSYACCGCGKKHDRLLYYCEGCNFMLNPECTLNPTAKYEFVRVGRIKHVLHNHPLTRSMSSVWKRVRHASPARNSAPPMRATTRARAFSLHAFCMESLPRAIWPPSYPEHPMMLRGKDQWFDRPCRVAGQIMC